MKRVEGKRGTDRHTQTHLTLGLTPFYIRETSDMIDYPIRKGEKNDLFKLSHASALLSIL